MEGRHELQFSYDWNQSHDQATVLLKVPYETLEEDIVVIIDGCYLLAAVRGQPPLIKGRLYGNIDPSSSWQLEPRHSRHPTRERTTSTTSTASTHSSYAFVSDPEISSSFAASLESAQVSDTDEPVTLSPPRALSSTLSSPARLDARDLPSPRMPTHSNVTSSRSGSPGVAAPRSMTSSLSSLESLHTVHSGRLLTLHLEKDQSVIWPSLIVGPVPPSLSPSVSDALIYDASHNLEHKYNMDPTSLVMIALELYDIRKDKEEAFECFVRAWLQAHVPCATMRLTRDYLPIQIPFEHIQANEQAHRGSSAYYLQSIGGWEGLAQLYLDAGLLHLEGAASVMLCSSHSTLSSIRTRQRPRYNDTDAEAWKRDREAASRFFERAKILQPNLDVPLLPPESDDLRNSELEMPTIELNPSAPESVYSGEESSQADTKPPIMRRRRKKEEVVWLHDQEAKVASDMDNAWYLYIPGLVGAGTALIVVGVIGALSLSTWRRNQAS